MRDSIDKSPATNPRDAGLAALILWIIVFAGFMVALMALNGNGHSKTADQIPTPVITTGPA